MKSIFFTLILSLLFFQLDAQTVKFNIMKGNDNIGEIVAKKTSLKSGDSYHVTSKATFRVVWKYVRETITKVQFSGKTMTSSNSKQLMNKETKEHRITTKNGTSYSCTKNPGNEKFTLNKSITYCSSMLYFSEPKNRKYIFAESYQKMCKIELISTGIYKLYLPEGKINHYVYKNGKLQEIRVFRTIVDLVFKRAS